MFEKKTPFYYVAGFMDVDGMQPHVFFHMNHLLGSIDIIDSRRSAGCF